MPKNINKIRKSFRTQNFDYFIHAQNIQVHLPGINGNFFIMPKSFRKDNSGFVNFTLYWEIQLGIFRYQFSITLYFWTHFNFCLLSSMPVSIKTFIFFLISPFSTESFLRFYQGYRIVQPSSYGGPYIAKEFYCGHFKTSIPTFF